jgi:hypothetical protein
MTVISPGQLLTLNLHFSYLDDSPVRLIETIEHQCLPVIVIYKVLC